MAKMAVNFNETPKRFSLVKFVSLFLILFSLNVSLIRAQSPNISYSTPQAYTVGTAISTLTPTNSGGAVPASIPGVSTLAGNGIDGFANASNPLNASFSNPIGVALDATGNVYVADFSNHRIRKIDASTGAVTTLAGNGTNGFADATNPLNASFSFPNGVAVDAAGNVYVVDNHNHRIRKIDATTGAVNTLAGNGNLGFADATNPLNASFYNPTGVAVDAAGNLYVADTNNQRIRKIDAATGAVTTIAGNGTDGFADATNPLNASFHYPTGVTVDAAGNVYVADKYNNRIRKIDATTGAVTTLAGNGAAGFADDTNPLNARFHFPMGVVVDAAGNLYVSDYFNNRIRKIDAATGAVTTLAGNGTFAFADATNPLNANFNNPYGVAVDATGNVFVADIYNHRIRKISLYGYSISPALPAGLTFDQTTGAISSTPTATSAATNYTVTATNSSGSSSTVISIAVNEPLPAPNISYTTPQTYTLNTPISTLLPNNTGGAVPATITGTVSTLAGNGTGGFADATNPLNASFTNPAGVAVDAAGNVYVADFYDHRIRKIDASNGAVTTLAGNGTAGFADATNPLDASFSNPTALAVDAAGNVYVADFFNQRIRKIDASTGAVTTLAGNGTAGFADAANPLNARFYYPSGIAIDATGNVYVADFSNHRIRKIDASSGAVTTLAGNGTAGFVDATNPLNASLNGPVGVVVDASGNVYVADQLNNRIRKIDASSGAVTTLAGNGIAGFADAANPLNASFNNLTGVAVDALGNLYVADYFNHRIRKIDASTGAVTTLAGNGTAGFADATNPLNASFKNPALVALDAAGNVYVADYNNHRIRKISITGYYISPALPTGLTFDQTTGAISGTPTTTLAATNYTITATNSSGSNSTIVSITVIGGAPNISYSTPQTFTSGTAVTIVLPTNTGGEVPTSGSTVSTFAGGTSGAANGTGTQAQFNYPYGIATDATGNVFVADQSNHSIRKISPTRNVTTIAGATIVINDVSYPLATSVDGTGTAASFNTPSGVAVDNAGTVFVAEQNGNKIRKITPAGEVTTFAGSGLQGLTDGTGTAAEFNQPTGVAVDVAGNVYVADNMNNAIRKITPDGVVTTLAGGTQGAANGTGTEASFNGPTDLAVDAAGNVFVTDQANNLIRKITPAGVVTTFAGNAAENAYNDGIGIAASFNYPTGITIDASGNMYVADQYNYRIRKISPDAVVTTIAGDGTDGAANGAGLAAQFSSPLGVAWDGRNNLYVSDMFNNSIRKIAIFGYSISPKLPAGLSFNTTTGAITGTPTENIPATNFTVTATNQYGSHSTVISLAVSSQIATSIYNTNDNAVKVYATTGRKIAIAGVENAEVSVFNQLGQQLYNANVNNGIIQRSFVPGVYIVRVNSSIRKVIVR